MFLKVVVALLSVGLALSTAGLIGAPMDADMNEQGVQNALRFAVAQHNKASNDMYVSEVSRVISVKKQLVSGMKYIFNVEMATTSCRKGGVEELCAIHSDPAVARPRQCTLVVWSQPWLPKIEVLENTCQ